MNLTAESIRRYVGATLFNRGRDYFMEGNVSDIEIDESTITGLVQGSAAEPYLVEVEVKQDQLVSSECSCPVGYACKHVAALCLGALPLLANMSSSQAIHSAATQLTLQPDWHQKINQLIASGHKAVQKTYQLQLLIKIEQKLPYEYYIASRRSRSGKVPVPAVEPEVLLRPRLYDPENGNYSVSEINWQSGWYGNNLIYWKGVRGEVPSEQFYFLQMLSRAFSNGYVTGWVAIPEEKAGYIWQFLKRATQLGVKLMGGQKGQIPVEVSDQPIIVSLEVSESDKNLLLRKKLTYQTSDITMSNPVLIGDPIAFAIRETPVGYFLHPVTGENSQKALKQLDKPLEIPNTEVREFEQYLPKLGKRYQLDLNTKTVSIPETVVPRPVIRMRLEKKMRVKIEFGLQYENTSILLIDTPEVVTLSRGTVLLDQHKVSLVKNILQLDLQNLADYHQYPVAHILTSGIVFEGLEAARFKTEIIPKLQLDLPDLIIQEAKDLPNFTLDTSEPEIAISIEEDKLEGDWFDLGISVLVGSEKVPFQQLFSALVEGQEFLLLDSGRYFSLKVPQFDQLRRLIDETKSIKESEDSTLKISRFQAGLWEELQRLGVVAKQSEKWQQTMQGLLHIEEISLAKVPSSLQATLRPYQREGFSWLKFLRDFNLGGILADDMGLGKTVQTISLILEVQARKKHNKPFLVIAPTSVVENWDSELEHFAPSLKRLILRSGNRNEAYKSLSKAHIVVTSYALLVRDFDKLKQQTFDTVILDEAQMVKNYQSKAYALIRQLHSGSKIALTGTPLENNLMELWSIFSIVAPGLFPEPKKFQELYRTPIEKHQDTQALHRLRSRVRPFMMRRQKSIVEKQLPIKNEQVLYLNLNPKHRHLYDLQLQQERKRVLGLLQAGGLQEHRFEILRSLMKMRQMCLHPHLVDKKHLNIPATKIEYLKEQIEEIVSENHRVLIFSQFTSFLAKVKEVLDQLTIEYLYLDGQTKNRGELVKKFQIGNIPVFIISLKSGGFGLNLTAADYCILLDPWWNPAVEQQAVDRTHRIGQTRPVFVYKMIAKDTIEEKVLQLQQKKQKLFQNVMEDDNLFGSAITEQDIHRLFEIY